MLPEVIGIITTLLFGATTVYFAIKEEKQKHALAQKDTNQKQRLYEISILKEIQERIGYELDTEKVVDVLTGSIKNLFPYSTTSSLLIKTDDLVFHTYVEEPVSHAFIQAVKQSMLASLGALSDKPLTSSIKEQVTGVMLDDTNAKPLASFFHIPLIINDKVAGLINISSTKPGLYKQEEMTILYQITHQASGALSRLQEVLHTEKGKLLATIGSLEDGLFMIDKNNQLLIINDAAKNLLKIQKPNPNLLDVLGPLQGSFDIGKTIQIAFADKKVIEEKEVKLEEKTIHVFLNPVIEEKSGNVIGISVLLHDITLEKNLAALKEDFTNMVVHELRAPLTAIKGATQLINKTAGLNPEEQKKLLQIIEQQSQRLLDEVSSLLDAAKLESGKFTIQKAPSDLEKLIDERLAFFSPQIHAKQIALEKQIEENLPILSIDSFRIGQVLNNLLSNSIKFTPEGGKITIKVSKVPKVSEVSKGVPFDTFDTSQPFDTLAVSISDTGIGIPPEQQAKLFSKFSQAGHVETGERKGTGLGLFIAKGIVEAHGGTIKLESDEGRGTTITFTLPYETQAPLNPQAKPNPHPYPPPSQIFGTAIN